MTSLVVYFLNQIKLRQLQNSVKEVILYMTLTDHSNTIKKLRKNLNKIQSDLT